MVHLLHLLFSILVSLNSTSWRLFTCLCGIPEKGTPQVLDIPVETFVVRQAVCYVLQLDHMSHLEGVNLLV